MRIRGWVAAAAAFLAFVVVAIGSARAQAAQVDDVLSAARAAMGGDAVDRVTALHERGTIVINGSSAPIELWCDARIGAISGFIASGPFAGADGFDGNDAWTQDQSGLVWVNGGKAGRYQAIADAYLRNHALLRPSKRGAAVYVGSKGEGGSTFDVLSVTPPKGSPIQIWLDATTHRIARSVTTMNMATTTTAYSDYRSVAGLMVPFKISAASEGGNAYEVTLADAQANPQSAGRYLVKPDTHPLDFSISSTSLETTVPIELVDNHVYLSVMLNGKGPYRFVFDTGGANVIDSSVAAAIGATSSGSMQAGGAGSQTESVSFAKVASLDIGLARIRDQNFVVLPIRQSFGVAGGQPADGLIGFEVLSRFITTFDYGQQRLTLRLRDAGEVVAATADVIPFVFNDTVPQIPCKLDGIAGDCSVDTGSRVSATLLTPFVTANPNVVPANATAVGVDGFGVGGPAMGRLGRLTSLQLGRTTLNDLIADFSAQKEGYFSSPFIAANIGGGVWKRFTVTFNYAAQTIAIVPNSSFADREEYDRSGLFLIAPGGTLTVLAARPGTPAGEAGLNRGDAITAINGTAGVSLLQARQMLAGPPGTNIDLSVKSKDGKARDVRFTLRDYV